MKLNKILSRDEQMALSADFEFTSVCGNVHTSNRLPMYVREAMQKNGVVRLSTGAFVKKCDVKENDIVIEG